MPDNPVGRRGRVTGAVGPGTVGEVTLPFQGGSYPYLAHPSDGTSRYGQGVEVEVMSFIPPRTVFVQGVNTQAPSQVPVDTHQAFLSQ